MIDFLEAVLGLFYFGVALLAFGSFAVGFFAMVWLAVEYAWRRIASW